MKKLEGRNAAALEDGWRPVVAQAGTYAGFTSIAYATTGWFTASVNLYAAGTVRFYLIRK